MLFERIESEGLAHYSYLVGDGGEAVVIDPRRDCQVYLDRAFEAGYRIGQILETHRNEDYVVGSCELAARTDAQIWHADQQLDYSYGEAVDEGQTWQVGGLSIKAIHSPGHTPGSMSYLMYDADGAPWMVFCGDVLFAGDVGRVDLMGVERAEEMAGELYDTIFQRLLPLGDEVILCPAHGAGSVCGSSIVDRPWTTIGIERRRNPRLQHGTREAFVGAVAQELERPPYFDRMEAWNVSGSPLLANLKMPAPLPAEEFDSHRAEAFVLDTRSTLAFGAAHVPKSLSIWRGGLASFAGWFLDYEQELLVVHEGEDPRPIVDTLRRVGYDDVSGTLGGGMLSWHTAGKESSAIETMTVQALCRRLDAGPRGVGEDLWILDVRSDLELEQEGEIPGAHHIHITQLPAHLDDVPRARGVTIFCGSGLRSMIGASLLRGAGWRELAVVLGGVAGWDSVSCPIEPGRNR